MKNQNIPEERVKIKLSVCSKCEGIVRASVVHTMNLKEKNEFAREVMKYNLSVQEIPLKEYRNQDKNWCECKE